MKKTFYNCSSLTNVDFGNGYVPYDNGNGFFWISTFEGCSKLTTIDLKWVRGYEAPASFSYYMPRFDKTFSNCLVLESVYIDEGMKDKITKIDPFENAGVSDFTYVTAE